jgi:uncharacterized protein YecE (DUF72 family)
MLVQLRSPKPRLTVEHVFERTAQSRLFAQPWHSLVRDCGHSLPLTTSTTRAPIDGIRTLAAATAAELAVVRFHGRDPKAWQQKTVSERFRYHYQEQELQEWVPKVQHLAEGAREIHVLMNNCFRDQAVTNARQLADLLSSADVAVVPPGT